MASTWQRFSRSFLTFFTTIIQIVISSRKYYGFLLVQYIAAIPLLYSGVATTFSTKGIYFLQMLSLQVLLNLVPVMQQAIWTHLKKYISPAEKVADIYRVIWTILVLASIFLVVKIWASSYKTGDFYSNVALFALEINLLFAWIWAQAVGNAKVKAKVLHRHTTLKLD